MRLTAAEKKEFPRWSSDLFRMAVLYKYGGFYFDEDIILLKRLDFLPQNFIISNINQSEIDKFTYL